jgi:hypothetical protein
MPDPLATVADFEDRLGRAVSDEDERLRLEALLRDASAAVRAYTGRQWLTGTVTTSFRPRSDWVKVPNVDTITSVVNPATSLAVPYQYDGVDRLYIWPALYRNALDYDWAGMPGTVVVTYVADDPAPDAVIAVVCQMAARAFGLSPLDSGHQQESIAGYSYSVGTAAAAGAVGMLQGERDILDLYRVAGGTIWVNGT